MSILFAIPSLALVSTPWISLPVEDTGLVVHSAQLVLEGGGIVTVMEWPVVVGEADDPAVEAINASLSWETVTGQPLEETVAIFADIQRGYTGADYAVNYDAGGILDITITTEFVGAYPSTERHYFCFDASTGERLGAEDILDPRQFDELVSILDAMLQERIGEAVLRCCEDGDGVPEEIYEGYGFTVEDLECFTVAGDGIWFHYDFGFPHVIEAAEPDGELFLPVGEITPFLAG